MGKRLPMIVVGIILLISIALIGVHEFFSKKHQPHIDMKRQHPLVPDYMDLMVLFAALLVSYIVSALSKKHQIHTPHHGFVIIIAYLWGSLSYYDDVLLLAANVMYISPRELLFFYMVVTVFYICFTLDVPIFLKTLPQIVVIGIPGKLDNCHFTSFSLVALVTAVLFGMLTTFIIGAKWSSTLSMMFGTICMPSYSRTITLVLRGQSTRTKQLSILLEGEAVVTFIVTEIIYELMPNNILGLIVHWFQFVAIILRFISIGVLTGYIFGLLCKYFLRKMYSDKMSVCLVYFICPFFVYSLSEIYLSGCGSISIMILGIMLASERMTLEKDVEKFLIDLWHSVGFILSVVPCVVCSMVCAVEITPFIKIHDYFLAILVYIVYYVTRFVCFFLFSPIISRLGYGMDFKNMVVCVWGGSKTTYSLLVVAVFAHSKIREEEARIFYFYIIVFYLLSILINGTFMLKILTFMDLTKISDARKANMTSCVRHVLRKRDESVFVLKMDRFLGDADWEEVFKATTIQHPYEIESLVEQGDDFFVGYKFTYCSDCKKDIPQEPTSKQMKEMTREARMRVLKAKKMSYSRQFENGMISKECIRILSQAVELAMDSENAVIQVEDLHSRFTNESCFRRFVRKRCEEMDRDYKAKRVRPPRTYWRRVCFHWVVSSRTKTFEKIMIGIVVSNLGLMSLDFYCHPSVFSPKRAVEYPFYIDYGLLVGKVLFATIYVIECVIRILAYSHKYIWAHGVRTYFKSVLNIIDFIIIIRCIVDISLTIKSDGELDIADMVVDVLGLLRVCRLLRGPQIFYPTIIYYLNKHYDREMALTYELGKSYTTGESEILDMLPYMVDNRKIRAEIKTKIENDRVVITKLLGTVQKDRPWIAITVKTKQAIRTVLSAMHQAIADLKIAGWTDALENEKLGAGMDELYVKVNNIKMVQPSPPRVIFNEVAWMARDEAVIEFLFEDVTTKTFEPGQVIFDKGNVADGIYVVVTGLFKIVYLPDENTLEDLQEHGKLPVVDYMAVTNYNESSTDYIVSGNCIGELSCLTGRPYNSTITADSHSQAYVLSRGAIKRAAELSPDPITGLECRIWKEVSIRIAVPLLLSTPAYQSLPQDQIKYALERAFVPDLSYFKIFSVTDMIEDILLIDGVAADYNSRDVFVAPCCIPRTVQKLILPKSSLANMSTNIETKLLIIPAKDVDEYDVMMLAEETCEMVDTGTSSKCLLHTVQARSRKQKRLRMRGVDSSRSRYRRRKYGDNDTMSISKDLTSLSEATSGRMFYRGDKEEATSIYMGDDADPGIVKRSRAGLTPASRQASHFTVAAESEKSSSGLAESVSRYAESKHSPAIKQQRSAFFM